MDPLQIYLVTQIFNYAIDQLKVANKGRYSPTEMEVKEPCEIRFESKIHESVYQQLDPLRPSEEAMNEQEVEEETNSLISLYIETMKEIREKGTFNGLLEMIQSQIDEADDEDKLIANHERINKHYNDVRYKWKHHDAKGEKMVYNREDTVRQLRAEFTNIQVVNEIEVNLVKNWEATRYEQGILYTKNVERDLLNELRYYDRKIRQEENALANVEKYYEEKIEDLRERLKFWTQKYEEELEKHNNKIKELVDTINKINSDHEEHLKTHREQKKFIEEYTEQKKIEEEQLQEEEKRIESTIVIQSWWRGTMVRQHLGPYRSKKKKGKKGKKGK